MKQLALERTQITTDNSKRILSIGLYDVSDIYNMQSIRAYKLVYALTNGKHGDTFDKSIENKILEGRASKLYVEHTKLMFIQKGMNHKSILNEAKNVYYNYLKTNIIYKLADLKNAMINFKLIEI
jgi:hypothetical protein